MIDVAEPQGRKTFLRDKELAAAIRGYYGARTGMLIAFWGILLGLVLAILWVAGFGRRAMRGEQPQRRSVSDTERGV